MKWIDFSIVNVKKKKKKGIVHGTVLTVLGAARKYLGVDGADLRGVVYVTSGLGGMSGAQGKATVWFD